MFTPFPNFCRVCLKHHKNLIDLDHIENEPSETLISKLNQCVSEVEWSVYKPLLCHPCIKRLNIAYNFQKQCVQSVSVLKSYMGLVQENKLGEEAGDVVDNTVDPLMVMPEVMPNQNLIKIVMGPQNPSPVQNLFVNFVPSTTITPVIPVGPIHPPKPTNQSNVFTNLNDTLQKFIPSPVPQLIDNNSSDVGQFLTEGNTEEVSCEIDPLDFGFDDNSSETDGWQEFPIMEKKPNGYTNHNWKSDSGGSVGNFVPILPKQPTLQDQNSFSNSGQHFLSSTHNLQSSIFCEPCQKSFLSAKSLRNHIYAFHDGKYPFKCGYCHNEYVLRADYEKCLKLHQNSKSSLLKVKNSPQAIKVVEEGNFYCELCKRTFSTKSGLWRHKVRKHNQKNRNKYFIKGMKNAKCDICKREFSTQSYMQLHRKLHLRDSVGYKYKVFEKCRYMKIKSEEPQVEETVIIKQEEDYSDSDENRNGILQPEVVMDSSSSS